MSRTTPWTLALAAALALPLITRAQDDQTRTLVPEKFLKARPAAGDAETFAESRPSAGRTRKTPAPNASAS